ncbi:Ig-like domain-containing protein [Microbacterium esteraromaticum]|uniref:Ig-like domain-containing protein n=1 Tax=Microbacterium esteraromaticum TaxID=57043 RepID=UPI0019575222|nr:Ig-like domain-containing protein [Microbacterium esteraromaticum]MBM7465915.1 hypothetical protein [Microbacterium esteraromaticum]
MTEGRAATMPGTALRSTALAVLLCALLAVAGLNGLRFSTAAYTSQSTNTASTVGAAADWTPPTVSVVAPSAPLKGAAALTVNAADGETGVKTVVVQSQPVGGSTWTTLCSLTASPYTCTWQTATVADGAYDVRAIATDNSGYSTTSAVVRVSVSNAFGIVLTDPGDVLRGTVPLQASLQNADMLAAYNLTFEYSVAGSGRWTTISVGCPNLLGGATCTRDWSTTGIASGTYDLRAKATPLLGATVYSTVYTDITIDNTAPTVSMTTPTSPLSGAVTLSATAADADSGIASVTIQYQAVGGAWTTACVVTESPYSCRFSTVGLANGSYIFRAVAADLAGNTTTSASTASRTIDNTMSSVSLDDPAAYLSGTTTLTAQANSTAGVSSVTIQYAPAGTTSWATVCTRTAAPYSCSWNTTTVADGAYDLRAVLVDGAGKTTTSAIVTNRRVDNAPVRGADVQTANGAGTAGRVDVGDSITFTYSKQMSPASIAAGWNGGSTAVTLRLRDGGLTGVGTGSAADSVDVLIGSSPVNLGSVNLRGDYIKTGKTSTYAATMTATTVTVNGASVTVVTVTVGSLTSGGAVRTATTSGAMIWTPSTNATDLTGAHSTNAPVTETGALDREF